MKIFFIVGLICLLPIEMIYAAGIADMANMAKNMSPAQQAQLIKQMSPAQKNAAMRQVNANNQTQQSTSNEGAYSQEASAETIEQVAPPQPAGDEKKGELPGFGYDLFAGAPSSFVPSMDIPIPAEYVIGPGDSILIQLFGKVNEEYSLQVTREGMIDMPEFGPISVAGLKYEQMKNILNKKIKLQKIGTNASISLGALRSIRVFVLGDANRPGSFLVSSLSTLTNALFASGGVKKIGSLRNIQLKRKGKVVKEFDLYDLLLQGDTSNDSRLQPGDVIFVPPIGKTVSISGEVLRPATYEIKNEKSMADLFQLAGGLKPEAMTDIQVVRINKVGQRVVLDLDQNEQGEGLFQLTKGDQIRVESVLDGIAGKVELSGHVNRPGISQWFSGMRITDLFSGVHSLLPGTNLEYAIIKRINPADLRLQVSSVNLAKAMANPGAEHDTLLEQGDEIVVYGLNEKITEQLRPIIEILSTQYSGSENIPIVEIHGNVKNPGSYPFESGMTIQDLLKISFANAAGLDKESYLNFGAIQRLDSVSGSRKFIPVNLQEIVSGSASVQLLPGDRLVVLSRDDINFLNSVDVLNVLQGEFASLIESKGTKKSLQINIENTDTLLSEEERRQDNDKDYLNEKAEVQGVCLGVEVLAKTLSAKNSSRLSFVGLSQGIKDIKVRQTMQCPAIFEQLPRLLTFLLEYSIVVRGEVQIPSIYPIFPDMPFVKVLELAGGASIAKNFGRADLLRYNQDSSEEIGTSTIISLDFSKEREMEILLRPGDSINIHSAYANHEERPVTLKGEFRFPGQYFVRGDERLSQLIARAGGLTEQAYPFGAVFLRERVKEMEKRANRRSADELRDILARAMSKGESFGGAEIINQLIERLEEKDALGRMVVETDPTVLDIKPELDILLESGDQIFVPKRSNVVHLTGEVLNPGTFLFRPGFGPEKYVKFAGGATESAEIDNSFVVFPNGEAQPIKISFWDFSPVKVPPGSTIIVPRDLTPIDFLGYTTKILAITRDMAITAAALKTIN